MESGRERAKVGEVYLPWRYVPRLLGYARYGGFGMMPACAFFEIPHRHLPGPFMSALVVML